MILGITPARGGSKGIKRKNIKPIAGKPLIAWTIEAAKQSRLIDRFVVSTEDAEIAKVARAYGAEVLDRPAELATDEATTMDVLQHALQSIPCDTVVLLQATTPIRPPGLIDECIGDFLKHQYDSLVTGFICKYVEYGKDVELSSDGKELRRQDVPGFFYDDGNIYIMKADLLKKGDRYGKRIGYKHTNRFENIDIDEEFDFWLAERVLQEKKHL